MDTIIILLALISVPLILISTVTYFMLPFWVRKMSKKMDIQIRVIEELHRELEWYLRKTQ